MKDSGSLPVKDLETGRLRGMKELLGALIQGFMKIYDGHPPYEIFICRRIKFGYEALNVNLCASP